MVKLLPRQWSTEWLRPRRARIVFRRGDGFAVEPRREAADGQEIYVNMPRIMEPASKNGHSQYAGEVTWDVIDPTGSLPGYVCEKDLIWLDTVIITPTSEV